MGADAVTELINVMGLGHMDQDMFVEAVRCCAIRNAMVADYAGKRFVPAEGAAGDVVKAGVETSHLPSTAIYGLGA